MFKKWYVKIIIVILLALALIWLGKLFYYYQQQRTIELVNRELQFSGIKIMMDMEDIQNISHDYIMNSVIDGYHVNFKNIDLIAYIFALSNEKSRCYKKVVTIMTRNEEHQLFGFNRNTPLEKKIEILKKHGFRYKEIGSMNYFARYGVNIRVDSPSDIIIYVDNPDNYMGGW
jgi:hypothetical protein